MSPEHRLGMGVSTALLLVLNAFKLPAQKAESTFTVLRSDRVTERVQTERGEQLFCSIVGLGKAAQINCNSSALTAGVQLVYHVALIVGSNQVGYIVSCGGGLLPLIGCEPLTPGQTVSGVIEGGKLRLRADGREKTYKVVNSSYLGPVTGDKGTATAASPSFPAAAHDVISSRPTGGVEVPPEKPESNSGRGAVTFTSEPLGAEINIDGKFVGNTPSLIQLEPGSHTVSIEATGHKTWARTIEVTAGSKALVQAKLH